MHLEFFAALQHFNLLIPRLLAQPLNNVLRNRVWESLPQIMTFRLAYNCRFYIPLRSVITLRVHRP